VGLYRPYHRGGGVAYAAVLPHPPGRGLNILTKRESEVLSLIKAGLVNREIAVRLGITTKTVQNIATYVKEKLYITSFREL
jgi:DNA-binding NarL/FixJ family response regulator